MITSEQAKQISSCTKLESIKDFETLISRLIEEAAGKGDELKIFCNSEEYHNLYDYIETNKEAQDLLKANGFYVYIDNDYYTDYNSQYVRISW